MKPTNVLILSILGILSAAHGWSQDGPYERPYELRYARICDPSGCYLAQRVVDSDHDGVCDADELMAGTDPHDPLSKPSLTVVAELASAAALPSFETGFGAFILFPEKLQTMLEESQKDRLSAFPMKGERLESLSRLGISAELMSEHGVDPSRDGLTVGLDRPDKDGMPGRRVSGIDVRLISEGSGPAPSATPGATPGPTAGPTPAGTPGATPDPTPGATPGGTPGATPAAPPNPDDPVPLHDIKAHGHAKDIEIRPNGDTVRTYQDGSIWTSHKGGGGEWTSKDGKRLGWWYVNPDADQGSDPSSGPTPEQEKAFLRMRGAVILTVQNWSAPDLSAPTLPEDRRKLIALVDPDYIDNTAFVSPAAAIEAWRLSEPQPETRPDLPQTGVPAPGGKPGTCTVGCVEG